MRFLRVAFPALLLIGLTVSGPQVNADPPTRKTPTTNKRITLYNDGKRAGVLMFYGGDITRVVVVNAKNITADKAKPHESLRLTGDVELNITTHNDAKHSIKLTADEILVEILPDQPLPADF